MELIRERTDPVQWHHVDTKLNPADLASRGLEVSASQQQYNLWFKGPQFLWKPLVDVPCRVLDLPEDDPEVKRTTKGSQNRMSCC